MIILRPFVVDDDCLIYTNVAESPYPDYSDSAAYQKGDLVKYERTLYECLADSATGKHPTDTSVWLVTGTDPKYAPFDGKVGTVASANDQIVYEFRHTRLVGAVALFGLGADSVTVSCESASAGEVYSKTFGLHKGFFNAYDYCFAESERKETLYVSDLPNYLDQTIRIEIQKTGGEAQVGNISIGSPVQLGQTKFGMSFGIQDFSTKSTSEFGITTLIKRDYVDALSASFVVDTARVSSVKSILAASRSEPVCFVPNSTDDEQIVYGYFEDFSIDLSNAVESVCSIEIRGLIA